jgi:integrase
VDVPLPGPVSLALAAHLEKFPAVPVTLPWGSRDGKPRTELLLFVTPSGRPPHRGKFNSDVWVPARHAAGIGDERENGMHALRHHYASVLLRGGVDIKRVSSYLGHHSAAFTLSVYSHLMPDDEERSLREIEAALARDQETPPGSIASES